MARFVGRVERSVPIERHIEVVLVVDGYDSHRIRFRIIEIREILFSHLTRYDLFLSERTLDRYLHEIHNNGTR